MSRQSIIDHIPRLRRYARALMRGDALAADDLVQDCLERALGRLELWRPGSDLRAWLFSIMHNLYVNRLRRQSLEAAVTVNDESLAERAASPHAPVTLTDLERALESLSPDQREIVLMVALEGLAYRQVSVILGVPEGTIMSRLARARAQLRHALSGEPGAIVRRIG
jgi:RNA polymerase sigma-70 factor (ECF subfamily)